MARGLACVIIPATLGLAACGGDASSDTEHGDKDAKSEAKGEAMPGMPGMKSGAGIDSVESTDEHSDSASSSVVLTASQIRNGAVRWEAAALGTGAALATVPGELLPNEDRTARLGAPAGGRVVAVRVQPGERVRRGDVLVTLQSPEAGMAQSDVTKAEAEVASRRAQATYAKTARERAERLLALKAIPRQDYDRATADDELARAALAQAEAEFRRARSTAAQLGAEASSSGEVVIRAPIAGAVLDRTAVPGTVVEAGAPLVVITEPSTLWLSIDVPETLAGQFRVGGLLRFSVPAFGARIFTARTEAVGAGLSPERRTLPVRALVTNGDGRLKPAMVATVFAAGSGSVSAVLLPDDAVQLLDGRPVVFIAKPDSGGAASFTARPVTLGARAGGRTAVTSGLAPGELVVMRGAFGVKAQLKKGSMPEMEMHHE